MVPSPRRQRISSKRNSAAVGIAVDLGKRGLFTLRADQWVPSLLFKGDAHLSFRD